MIDIVSPSYGKVEGGQGAIHYFEKQNDGTIINKGFLKSKSGKLLFSGFSCTTPNFIDWDADGDLDILSSSYYSKKLMLSINSGTKDNPCFEEYQDIILEPISKTNKYGKINICNAVCADWNADGLFDIVGSNFEGTVVVYYNKGEVGNPIFKKCNILIEGDMGIPFNKDLKKHGIFAKLHVVDYNNDGKLDLIVGDAPLTKDKVRTNSPSENKKLKEAEARIEEIKSLKEIKKYNKAFEKAKRELMKKQGGKYNIFADFLKVLPLMPEKIKNKAQPHFNVMKEQRKIVKKYTEYQNARHGYLWLYLGK